MTAVAGELLKLLLSRKNDCVLVHVHRTCWAPRLLTCVEQVAVAVAVVGCPGPGGSRLAAAGGFLGRKQAAPVQAGGEAEWLLGERCFPISLQGPPPSLGPEPTTAVARLVREQPRLPPYTAAAGSTVIK